MISLFLYRETYKFQNIYIIWVDYFSDLKVPIFRLQHPSPYSIYRDKLLYVIGIVRIFRNQTEAEAVLIEIETYCRSLIHLYKRNYPPLN